MYRYLFLFSLHSRVGSNGMAVSSNNNALDNLEIRLFWYNLYSHAFQTCTEIIFPMCANGINDIFESKEWSVKKHTEACFNIFGVRPNYDEITDYMYNAKNLSFASNIIFRYNFNV